VGNDFRSDLTRFLKRWFLPRPSGPDTDTQARGERADVGAEVAFLVVGIVVGIIVEATMEPPAPGIIGVTIGTVALAVVIFRVRIGAAERRLDMRLATAVDENAQLREAIEQRLGIAIEGLPELVRKFVAQKRVELVSLEHELVEKKRLRYPVEDVYPELKIMVDSLEKDDTVVAVASRNLDDFTERRGAEYLNENVKRARDGVKVRRLFVVDHYSKKVGEAIRHHAAALAGCNGNGEARWLRRSALSRNSPVRNRDFVIFGGQILITQEYRDSDQAEVVIDTADIRTRMAHFDEAWNGAAPAVDLPEIPTPRVEQEV
jgi:Family of unknown function (DUF6879)